MNMDFQSKRSFWADDDSIFQNVKDETSTESDVFVNDEISENDAIPVAEIQVSKRRQSSNKTNVLLMLESMSKDYKDGLDRLEIQNDKFIEAQKNIDAPFVQSMREVMAEDREEAQKFIKELWGKN